MLKKSLVLCVSLYLMPTFGTHTSHRTKKSQQQPSLNKVVVVTTLFMHFVGIPAVKEQASMQLDTKKPGSQETERRKVISVEEEIFKRQELISQHWKEQLKKNGFGEKTKEEEISFSDRAVAWRGNPSSVSSCKMQQPAKVQPKCVEVKVAVASKQVTTKKLQNKKPRTCKVQNKRPHSKRKQPHR
jgi:hypothetical protein